jgi:DNA polymerase I-like protein with 3'-5' exonuclease and polymerase domains
LLGWEKTNEEALEAAVAANGGRLSNGDHYLAPLEVLAHYAGLDAVSTLLLYERLAPWFTENNYWDFLHWRMQYHMVLTEATRKGTPVDAGLLAVAREELGVKIEQVESSIREVCADELTALEASWAEDKAKELKLQRNRDKYLSNPAKWRRFNPQSSHQRAKLLHGVLGLPILAKTPTGLPKMDRGTIARFDHPVAKTFVELSELAKLHQFVNGYLEALKYKGDGSATIHFGYNTCATVSDRLGGFAPYALNMPFAEASIMGAFGLPPGYAGIHSDLSAIEPCIIAAYSEDPTLLKVHRDGLGDIYLDFALEAFPDNTELKAAYDPFKPVTKEIKERFKDERSVCKIVHLAVGYTGTWATVHKSLQRAGFEVSPARARALVQSYWTKFSRVADLDSRLRKLHSNRGHLRNLLGRIIQVPEAFKKDTLNRFIQSSAHDALTLWVLEINRLRNERLPGKMYPVLPDIHDSTSWAVKEEHFEEASRIFALALRTVNDRLQLPVTIRAETKRFTTFAGLKGDES